jgi:hypothetical protein
VPKVKPPEVFQPPAASLARIPEPVAVQPDQPVEPPAQPPKPIDAVPEWLADDAEELAAKYDSRSAAARADAERARAVTRQAAQASQAAQAVAKRSGKAAGWGCLGGCLTFAVLQVLCLVLAFVAEEIAFQGRWGRGEGPFFILALLVPIFVGFGVMGLVVFLVRRKAK